MGRQRCSRGLLQFELVEFVLQDVADPLVGADAGQQRTVTGGFQPLVSVSFSQTENAQAGTVGLLGMSPGV